MVESVELNSTTKSNFDEIVARIANINLLFHDKTHNNLTMILDIQGNKIELAPTDANRLEKFMRRCLATNNDLHNLLNKDNTVTSKIKEIQALAKSKRRIKCANQTNNRCANQTNNRWKNQTNNRWKNQSNTKWKNQSKITNKKKN